MTAIVTPHHLLALETRALKVRLDQIRPFALLDASVPAAQISPRALNAIELRLRQDRIALSRQIKRYLTWLRFNPGSSGYQAQRRYTALRLRFNAVLSKFDIFADVITQRSEHETGIWLSGLDALARDAMTLPGFFTPPPVMCYLDRGGGAAIRRARTRLPGGGENPVAIIRIPRERMIGSGIASSLVHEAGHQAAASLGLVESLRTEIKQRMMDEPETDYWRYWERWISEIIADYWSVARVGIGSTLGLIGVVSLPKAFVFRSGEDDPHPIPWIRVKLSCAIGRALYPHPQWQSLADLWETLYPLSSLTNQKLKLLRTLEKGIPEFISLLINHRPPRLQGRSLKQLMDVEKRQPANLERHFKRWVNSNKALYQLSPTMVFAVIGQAKVMKLITADQESKLLQKVLQAWALNNRI